MAKYRQVHIAFWQDGFVLDLTPEEKYFYLYLMTNSKTSQCGIYELPKRIIETETGYNRETVDKLLQRFVDYGKILYDDVTKEIIILNWAKYNLIRSPKVIACIKRELASIKNKGFVHEFVNQCKQLGNDLGFLPSDAVTEQKKPAAAGKTSPIDAVRFYQENFGSLNPFMSERIMMWENDLGPVLVIEAMKRALKKQKMWGYAEGILKDWANQNVRSLIDVTGLDQEFASRGEKNGNKIGRRRPNQAATKNEKSITGNQVGWLRRSPT
ncbi:DnaD domain-containing protein [Peribacillus sp. JNUCC 23]